MPGLPTIEGQSAHEETGFLISGNKTGAALSQRTLRGKVGPCIQHRHQIGKPEILCGRALMLELR